jgi:hypothetical protein
MPRKIAPADSALHTNRRLRHAILPTEVPRCDGDIQSKGVQDVSQSKYYAIYCHITNACYGLRT